MTTIDLRCGDWRDVLADVECDSLIADPPYSEATHSNHNGSASSLDGRRGIDYASWSRDDVFDFVDFWSPRVRGWIACMTSHDLTDAWRAAYERSRRYSFQPVPVIQKRFRALGDGPASWAIYLMVARPRTREAMRWAALPGAYDAPVVRGAAVVGAKPRNLMRAIIGDYTNPGDVVCDPCAGGGTTLIAAAELGCTAVGAELDPDTYAKAAARCAKPYTPYPHPRASRPTAKPHQKALF